MSSAPMAFQGPCSPWISGLDVQKCCSVDDNCIGPAGFQDVADAASEILFEVSGRVYAGGCEQTVRPCQSNCGCAWGPYAWWWGPFPAAAAAAVLTGGLGGSNMWGWGWYNEYGTTCGCAPLSIVRLPGYPVSEIVNIKIDGDVLPAFDDNGNPNYRLDNFRDVIRMDDPGPPVAKRYWPGCQNLSLDDTQAGTFSVTYRFGQAPPAIGVDAAIALACELAKSCANLDCSVPANVTRIVRQGVTVDKTALSGWIDPKKPSGIPEVDLFLRTVNPTARTLPSVFWSPDVDEFARVQR